VTDRTMTHSYIPVKLKIEGVADGKLDGACKECLKSLVPAPEATAHQCEAGCFGRAKPSLI